MYVFLKPVLIEAIVSAVRLGLEINESLQMVTPILHPSVQSMCVISSVTGMAWSCLHQPLKLHLTDPPVHTHYSIEALPSLLLVQVTKWFPVQIPDQWMLLQI